MLRIRIDLHSPQLDRIEGKVDQLTIDQATFDTDLAALVASINTLVAAVEALPQTDLTAEDQSVKDAAQAVSDELAKLTPPAPTA